MPNCQWPIAKAFFIELGIQQRFQPSWFDQESPNELLSPVPVIYKKIPISGLVNKGLQAVKGKISFKQKLEKPAVEVLLEKTKWTVKNHYWFFSGAKKQNHAHWINQQGWPDSEECL